MAHGQRKSASVSRHSGIRSFPISNWLGMVGIILLYVAAVILCAGFGG